MRFNRIDLEVLIEAFQSTYIRELFLSRPLTEISNLSGKLHTKSRFHPNLMAFFGKMIDANNERKHPAPLQLPPPSIDKELVMKKFEKTLVGRVLNLQAQEHRVKALIAFLPSMWKCEGRA
ncbi:unnamed protein product [Arabis nemorensis]|uniref:Uncharacterized protein n=1 Tax=Arabis nemorensis TaxID=586526 RepID=A0A565CUV4_9BRAS|nr:unnamed protein product [Arabis nemorensis]